MELVRSLSTNSSTSRTEVHKQNRGVSKWSFSYVKELLLSAPRAPQAILPSNRDELLVCAPQVSQIIISTAAPTSYENVSTAKAGAPAFKEPLQSTDDNRTDTPAALEENAAISQHANVTERGNGIDEKIISDGAVRQLNESSQVLRLSKNLYIAPNMRTDYWSQELWTEQIKDRLNAELWHALRTERYLQEFMMAGPRPDCLRASIIITCCGQHATSRVRKVVKRLKWLKDFDVPCAVTVDLVHLCYQGQQQSGDSTSTIEALLPPNPTTLCGRRIRNTSSQDRARQFCTLGGLILIESFPFGMTVEHAFDKEFEVSGPQSTYDNQSGSTPDSLSGDAESEHPFISFDGESDGNTFENSFQSLHDQLPYVGLTDPRYYDQVADQDQRGLEGMVYRRIGKVLPSIKRDEVVIHYSNDWALIQIEDPSCFLLNEIKVPSQHESMIIADMVPNDFQDEGQVYVVLARGVVRAGWLISSPVLFKVGNSVMDTRLIIMDSKLAYGDSGAWVIHDGKLCGHVIGGKEHLPWAYMVPIRHIMQEIKLAFGTDNICFPKNVDGFPSRNMRQEPKPETNMDTYEDTIGPFSSLPPIPSERRIDHLNEKVTDSGSSSTQPHLNAPKYQAPNTPAYQYRTILSKMKEESRRSSTTALRSKSADGINAASALTNTLSWWQDPESWVPSALKKPKKSAFQHMQSTTRPRVSQHASLVAVVDDIEQVSALPDTSLGQGPESGIPSIPNVPPTRPSASPHTSPLHTVHSADPSATVSHSPPKRALRIRRLIVFVVAVIAGVLFIGLFVGLPVGLLLSHVGAGLPRGAKIGIGIGIGTPFVVSSLVGAYYNRRLLREALREAVRA